MADDQREKKVVHILHQGLALCGLRGQPRDWPAGHVWVSLRDRHDANCRDCLASIPHSDELRTVAARVKRSRKGGT